MHFGWNAIVSVEWIALKGELQKVAKKMLQQQRLDKQGLQIEISS